MVWALFAAGLLCAPPRATAQPIFSSDFETGDFSGWSGFAPADVTPPSVDIPTPTGPIVVNPQPTITVTYEDRQAGVDLATVAVQLDGTEITSTCTVTASQATCVPASPLADGVHQVDAEVADRAANTATARLSFTVDSTAGDETPPTIAVVEPVDQTTTANVPTEVIVAYDDDLAGVDLATLVVRVDAQVLSCTPAPRQASCALPALAEGAHEVEAEIRDLAGNRGEATSIFGIAPPGTDVLPPQLSFTAPSEPLLTTDQLDDIAVAYSDDRSGVDLGTLRVVLDPDADGGGTDLSVFCQPLADTASCGSRLVAGGRHVLEAEITDLAGNVGRARFVFDVAITAPDSTPPLLFVRAPSGVIENNAQPPVAIDYFDDLTGVDLGSLRVSLDGVDISSACLGTFSAATCPTPVLDAGPHTVTVEVADFAGNAANATGGFTLILFPGDDQTPPRIELLEPAGLVQGDLTPRILLRFDDAESGIEPGSLELTLDGVDLLPFCELAPSLADCRPAMLAAGDHLLSAMVRNQAGGAASGQWSFLLNPELPVSLDAPLPGTLSQADEITVSGIVGGTLSSIDTLESVTINEVGAVVNGASFVADVPLIEGSNTLTAIARTREGAVGTATITVVHDTEAPRAVIRTPPDGSVSRSPVVMIAGDIIDPTSSNAEAEDVRLRINGLDAEVRARSFVVPDFLLQPGENRLLAEVTDAAGNVATTESMVRFDPGVAGLEELLGNGQEVTVGESAPNPLTVRLVAANGLPLADREVVFDVSCGDGEVQAFPQRGRSVTVRTDDRGLASVLFDVGRRGGAGNHEVTATAPGFPQEIVFCLSARPLEPERIVPIVGANQQGARSGTANRPYPQPLLVQVFDTEGNPVSGVDVTYEVLAGGGSIAGGTLYTVATDAEGKAGARLTLGPEAGIDNNLVQATFDGLGELPAVFAIGGEIPGAESQTSISGVVLDNQDQAVPGASVRVRAGTATLPAVLTDAQGRFSVTPAPIGTVHLDVDGTTVTRPGTWPSLSYEIHVLSGVDNSVGKPLRLLPLDTAGAREVGGDQDVAIPIAGVAGAQITFFANSATFADGATTGMVSVTQVLSDKVPMQSPLGSTPMLAWTVQPPGVRFDPPARVEIPNQGDPRGAVVDIFSFDHDLGEFVPIGLATVSEDGTMLRSIDGSGIVESGWHSCIPPPPPPGDGCRPAPNACVVCDNNRFVRSSCDGCQKCDGSGGCSPKEIREVKPKAKGQEDMAEVGILEDVQFSVRVDGDCGAYEYEWDWGDGEPMSTGPNPKHKFMEEDTFTVTVTATCMCDGASPSSMSGTIEVEVKGEIEFTEVLANQMPPSTHCNMLPPRINAGINVPMLLGAASGNTMRIRVKGIMVSPPEASEGALVQVRKVGSDTKMVAEMPMMGSDQLDLEWEDDSGGDDEYEVIAGFDLDEDGELKDDEIEFEPSDFTMMPIPRSVYDEAKSDFNGSNLIVGDAVDFASVFTGGSSSLLGSSVVSDAAQLGNQDHPVGQVWNGACSSGPANRYHFATGNDYAEKFATSRGVRDKVNNLLVSKFGGDIRSHFGAPGGGGGTAVFPAVLGPGATWVACELVIAFGDWFGYYFHDPIISPAMQGSVGAVAFDLHIEEIEVEDRGIGGIMVGARFDVRRIRYRITIPQAVGEPLADGSSSCTPRREIYDFDISKSFFNRDGALLQSGFPFLGSAGHPFFTSLNWRGELDAGGWNFPGFI